MRLSSRLCALAAAAGIALTGLVAPGALAVPGRPAAKARIHLVAIDRSGRKTAVFAAIYTRQQSPIWARSQPVSVPRGPAWIAAEIDTSSGPPDNLLLSTTLVTRRVYISRSETIDLDARPGKLVTVRPPVPGATGTSTFAQACIGGGFVGGMDEATSAGSDSPVPLYVVPVRSKDLTFGYASAWQGSSASYLITGQSRGGIPSHPVYHPSLAGLAKVRFEFRTGEVVGGYEFADLENSRSCSLASLVSVGPAETEYVSAGPWTTIAYGYRAFWTSAHQLSARHSYAITFGAASWGPTQDFPSIQGRQLVFSPDNPISDPAEETFVCCNVSTVSLSLAGRVLRHAVISQSGRTRYLGVNLTRAGWYTLRISSRRQSPGKTIPASILSPRDSLVWRFRAAPQPAPENNPQLLPVTATRFRPGGLNLQNEAAAGASTPLAIQIVTAHADGYRSPPRHRVRSVTIDVSFNGGKTWHRIAARGHGTSWHATVQDPASGFVSLRSTVTDSAGDRSTETIYRAYSIGSA